MKHSFDFDYSFRSMIAALTLLFAIIYFAFPVQAQQPQRPSDEEINATYAALTQQRERANNEAAQYMAKVTILAQQLEEAKKRCPVEVKK